MKCQMEVLDEQPLHDGVGYLPYTQWVQCGLPATYQVALKNIQIPEKPYGLCDEHFLRLMEYNDPKQFEVRDEST